MGKKFHRLDWDSNFFGFDVGSIEGTVFDERDMREIEALIEENNCTLCYYSTPKELPLFALQDNVLDFSLVDRKITYSKAINPQLEIASPISNAHHRESEHKLIDLAIQSGQYSRFNVDKRITTEKFEEMYGLWIKNSLYEDLANEVLTYQLNGEVAGFVTIGEKKNRADIGLIAVDRAFRGKGIGKLLMNSAEKWCSNLKHETIQVVTQGDNIPAQKLYESCGYEIESEEMIYHIWKK